MICDYNDEYLINLISIQLRTFKVTQEEMIEIENILPEVQNRIQFNFSYSKNKVDFIYLSYE